MAGENSSVSPLVPAVAQTPNEPMLDNESDAVDDSKLSPFERQQKWASRNQKKIDQLTKEKYDAYRQVDTLNRSMQSLAQRLEQMETNQSSKFAELKKPASPYESFKIDELRSAAREMTLSDDPEKRKQAFGLMDEVSRREREEMLSTIDQRLGKDRESFQRERESASAILNAARLLGDDEGGQFVDFQSGSLRNTRQVQIADAVFSELKKKYRDSAESIPELRAYSILLANQALKAERAKADKEEARLKESTLLRSRISGQVGAKGEAVPEHVTEVNAALKANNVDGALSALVKNLEAKRLEKLRK